MTFAEEIEDAVGGAEYIEAIALSESRDVNWNEIDRLMTWAEARDELNYEYYCGYGSQDCHNIYVWTRDRIYLIHEYDGSTSIISVPRHPEYL